MIRLRQIRSTATTTASTVTRTASTIARRLLSRCFISRVLLAPGSTGVVGCTGCSSGRHRPGPGWWLGRWTVSLLWLRLSPVLEKLRLRSPRSLVLMTFVEREQSLLLDGLESWIGDSVTLVRVQVRVAHLLLVLLQLAYALGDRWLDLLGTRWGKPGNVLIY